MLSNFIRNHSFVVVAGYRNNQIIAVLGQIFFYDDVIEIVFPKGNPFSVNQKISFHLDDRTGLEELDIELRVYRTCVKAVVTGANEKRIYVEPVEYELKYGNTIVDQYRAPGYSFPPENRPLSAPPEAVINHEITPNIKDRDNKLGVIITKAPERPHTTVVSFLSSANDDIFIVSHNDSFKSHNLNRDADCVFAIDHRSTFIFEKAVDWNYTLLKGSIQKVSRENKMFMTIQGMFVDKNPWQYAFFTDKKVDMYYFRPTGILWPDRIKE